MMRLANIAIVKTFLPIFFAGKIFMLCGVACCIGAATIAGLVSAATIIALCLYFETAISHSQRGKDEG